MLRCFESSHTSYYLFKNYLLNKQKTPNFFHYYVVMFFGYLWKYIYDTFSGYPSDLR